MKARGLREEEEEGIVDDFLWFSFDDCLRAFMGAWFEHRCWCRRTYEVDLVFR